MLNLTAFLGQKKEYMEKIKVGSLPLKEMSHEADLIGVETNAVSKYRPLIDVKKYDFSVGLGIRIKTKFKTVSDRIKEGLFRISVYNHGTYEPNLILASFWMTSGGGIAGTKAAQLNSAANNIVTFNTDTEGYVCIEITALVNSSFLIEDLSSEIKGFSIITIP